MGGMALALGPRFLSTPAPFSPLVLSIKPDYRDRELTVS